MWTTRIPSRHRLRRLPIGAALAILLLTIVPWTGLPPAGAESSVKFLSEKVEGQLVPVQGGGYKTEKPVDILVQNAGDKAVLISFCLMPDGESECAQKGFQASIGNHEPLQADGSFQLEKGRIKDFKLDLALPDDPTAAAAVSVPTALPATPQPSSTPTSIDRFQSAVRQEWQDADRFVRNEQPKSQGGLLILRVDGSDADAIPYTLTPQSPPDSVIDSLTTAEVVGWAGLLAALVVLGAILFVLAIPGLERFMPGDPKYKLPLGALMQLPMGVAEWKLADSWVVNLSLAIAILGGIEGLLPDNLKSFKTSYSGLIFLFGVLTAFAAFAYNATTRPGPEKEEGTQNYKKQGRAGAYLVSSFLVVWALLGQLGLQLMAVERLRDILDLEIPGLFLIFFELLVFALIYRVVVSTFRTLRETILDQKIEAHRKAYRAGKLYRYRVVHLKVCALKWIRRAQPPRVLTAEDREAIKAQFAKLVPRLDASEEEDQFYEDFFELFHVNLPVLVDRAAQNMDAMRNLLRAIADDAVEAEKLLSQTLPVEEAVAAFYSSLWAPREVRKTNYTKALERAARHLRVACAQASSAVEPDRVIGPNEELYTNMQVSLDELDQALGLAGKKDPFYANLKKLSENAKLKWEVMKIEDLRDHLCGLAEAVEASKKKLEKFFDEKEQKPESGEGVLALTLEPLAVALGEPVPYPKTFPVDTDALDAAYRNEPDIKKAREKMATSPSPTVPRKTPAAKAESREPSKASMAKKRKSLQASMLAIASNPDQVTPYPPEDHEFQQIRSKALHQLSQKKVLGEDVTLL